MTCDEAHLFNDRSVELTELIQRHLERGSLDEGNAAAFDPIIEAWLQEELTALDREFAASVREEADRLAAAHAERQASRARAAAEEARTSAETARDASVREERRRLAEAAAEARTTRYAEEVRASRQRLEAAERQLEAATDLLLGTSFASPVARPVAPVAHPVARPVAPVAHPVARPVVRPVVDEADNGRAATAAGAVQGEVVESGTDRYDAEDDGTGDPRMARGA
jgi:hypothetical protein